MPLIVVFTSPHRRQRASMACWWNFPAMCRLAVVSLLVAHLLPLAAAAAGSTKNWLTLNGSAPKVVARGGFSGLFPDSSGTAYNAAIQFSVRDVILWCDVQLTKDGASICFPSLTLDTSSSISSVYSNKSTYSVNGDSVSGFFTIDYSLQQLHNVILTQGVSSRPTNFDYDLSRILSVQDLFEKFKPGGFWLNVQHDMFFSQHKLSIQSFLLDVNKNGTPIAYLSSPEVAFLRGIGSKLNQTNLVFYFLQENETEPSTNQTYGTLLKNLTFIKSFADGILVPKSYIWPSDSNLYLLPHTSLVHDAHAAGLQVFASDFANDNVLSYNYSYNPVAEYLQFIDNDDFSVDGFLSDFPITPSEAIGCFAHLNKNAKGVNKPLVISHNGASGDYPGCTDLAYTNAILDGADIIDCPVQMSKDGIPFCLSSINLMDSTTIAQTRFITLQENIAALNMKGIFSFRLTWKDIQGLTPSISNPFSDHSLVRNTKYKNAGKLVTLADFLGIVKNSTTLSGAVIRIENAAYLAQKEGMSVTDAVLKVIDNQTVKKVMIRSTNSSVLEVFKQKGGYGLVYELEEIISDVHNSTAAEIKSFADAVIVRKPSIYPSNADGFVVGETKIVDTFHAFNLSVFAQVFRNEFVSQGWDFLADAIVEINSFVRGAGIDAVITDFPHTAATYRKNRCLKMGKRTPSYMLPVDPGSLLNLMAPSPAEAPAEVLSDDDVSEPPLPGVIPIAAPPSSTPKAASTSDGNQLTAVLSFLVMMLIASFMLVS